MRKVLIFSGLIASLVISTAASADEYVQGYMRSDGTYVQGYYRSSPNGTTLDNYSTKGNVNPYTGQPGTRNPAPYNGYTPPASSNPYSTTQPTDPNDPN